MARLISGGLSIALSATRKSVESSKNNDANSTDSAEAVAIVLVVGCFSLAKADFRPLPDLSDAL